jgi:hypothetical protein
MVATQTNKTRTKNIDFNNARKQRTISSIEGSFCNYLQYREREQNVEIQKAIAKREKI